MWLILFFLSGVTGLLYEIVWIRVLSLVLGASVYSISVVFAAFMLGLGLGMSPLYGSSNGHATRRGLMPSSKPGSAPAPSWCRCSSGS